MKSAEELAKKIWDSEPLGKHVYTVEQLTGMITAFAEERVSEAMNRVIVFSPEIALKIRAVALEEAAKIVESYQRHQGESRE